MTLPNDEVTQFEFLRLLTRAPDGGMHSNDVYKNLAYSFPSLTEDETSVPYQNSQSHWANRGQFARLHLVKKGWLLTVTGGGRGYWKISPEGRKALTNFDAMNAESFAQIKGTP